MSQPRALFPSRLRQGITDAFSAEELITLCSDLGVDYESLGGEGKEAKARELIEHLVRRDQLAPLVAYCLSKRPRYPWPEGSNEVAELSATPSLDAAQTASATAIRPLSEEQASLQRQLVGLRENLRLIEERMSEFVEFTAVPLQLVKNKRQTEARIAELERRLAGLARD
ncbi:MAG: hypothetical protein NT169_25685 [Chloroflexi bacterium]|nr:hypothetical protein [Chloroflexota bacterium]